MTSTFQRTKSRSKRRYPPFEFKFKLFIPDVIRDLFCKNKKEKP